jgi:hypothetical protein
VGIYSRAGSSPALGTSTNVKHQIPNNKFGICYLVYGIFLGGFLAQLVRASA